MAYTVKKLSKLSGVTIRTLHYYEEIGLLKPAYYGSNGYRYYEEKELLVLQNILFFKELGLTLKQIQAATGKEAFQPLATLSSHRMVLTLQREKIDTLLDTIDRTIEYLKGKKHMKDREFFDGFTLVTKATKKAPYYKAEEIVLNNLKEQPPLSAIEKRRIAEEANRLLSQIADALESGANPNASEVQSLIQKHYAFAERFHHLNKDIYKALAELYLKHPQYREQLDPIHPKLAEFLCSAMHTFAT